MANKYKSDPDLEMLEYADNALLETLVTYLVKDKDGDKRWTEKLTSHPDFKQAKKNHKQAWQAIAAELQHYGGDTLVNLFRNSGVSYKEILIDVCQKLKVKTDYKKETIEIEKALLSHVFDKAWTDMTESERQEISKQLKIDGNLKGSAALAAILSAIRLGGFTYYQTSLIIANAVAQAVTGQGIKILAGAGAARFIGIAAGPIGWAVTALLTIPSISGPAFRVTLPCVIQVAAIRQQVLESFDETPFF